MSDCPETRAIEALALAVEQAAEALDEVMRHSHDESHERLQAHYDMRSAIYWLWRDLGRMKQDMALTDRGETE